MRPRREQQRPQRARADALLDVRRADHQVPQVELTSERVDILLNLYSTNERGERANPGLRAHLAAMELILPGRLRQARPEIFPTPESENADFHAYRAIRSDSQNLVSHLSILVHMAVGLGRLPQQHGKDLRDRLRKKLDEHLKNDKPVGQWPGWDVPALLMQKIMEPTEPIPRINLSEIYRRLAREGVVPSYAEALLARLAEPEVNLLQELTSRGFSLEGLSQEIRSEFEQVTVSQESGDDESSMEAVFLAAEFLAFQTVLLASKVEVTPDGKVQCLFDDASEEGILLPERNQI